MPFFLSLSTKFRRIVVHQRIERLAISDVRIHVTVIVVIAEGAAAAADHSHPAPQQGGEDDDRGLVLVGERRRERLAAMVASRQRVASWPSTTHSKTAA